MTTTTPSDGTTSIPPLAATVRATTLVYWQHRWGGVAHCLARIHAPAYGRPVIILTEVDTNDYGRGVVRDPAAAADGLVPLLARLGVPHTSCAGITWLLHHGPFSYPDIPDAPEAFTEIQLGWDGSHFTDHPDQQRVLTAAEGHQVTVAAALATVPEALAEFRAASGARPVADPDPDTHGAGL
ncbi:MAG: hypothetical protein ACRCYX_05170 [Dermatophilaceae bacterium]